MQDIIKKLSSNSMVKNESLHRYYKGSNQDLSTIYDLKYCLRSVELYQEIERSHQYVSSIVAPLLSNYPQIQNLWDCYICTYEKILSDNTQKISKLHDVFQELADEWNDLQDDNESRMFARKKLDRNLFYSELSEEQLLLLTGAPFTGKTHTLTHYVQEIESNATCIFYANHFNSQNIQDEICNCVNEHGFEKFEDFVIQLNSYGKSENKIISITIDGINESPSFDVVKFKEEFEHLQLFLKEFPYIKILISIRQEYVSSKGDLYNHILTISEPSQSSIESLCTNLRIPPQVLNAMIDEPIGFYYLVADVLEKMSLEEKVSIKNMAKSNIFEKRWEQIEASCNKQHDLDITPLMIRNKMLEYIADKNTLQVPLIQFTDEEMVLLKHFQTERLVSIKPTYAEFQHQYYCDYYMISWLEKNWRRKQKNLVKTVFSVAIDIFWKYVQSNFPKEMPLNYDVDSTRKGIEYTSKNVINYLSYKFKDPLLTYKYHSIVKNLHLSDTQHIILLEHLREYDFEIPIKDLADHKQKVLWLESLRHLSPKEIENNLKIQERIDHILSGKKIKDLYLIWNKISKKAHQILLSMPLKNRDCFFSYALSDYPTMYQMHEQIDFKISKEWYHSFSSYTIPQKQNELYRLVWLFALPDRELRDKATRVLINVLCKDIDLFNELWAEMHNVNDPYVDGIFSKTSERARVQ